MIFWYSPQLSVHTRHLQFSRFCIIYLLGIRHNFRPIFATRYHLCYLLIFLALFCPIYLHVPHSPVIINIYQQIYFFKAFLSPLAFVTYLHLTILLLFAQLFVLRICPLFPYSPTHHRHF